MRKDSLAQRRLMSREALLSYRSDEDDRSSVVGFAAACGLGLMGVLWLTAVLLFDGDRRDLMIAIAGMVGIVPLFYGSCALDRAMRRRHGAVVAKVVACELLDHLPKQWDVIPGGFLPSAADIDLAVRLPTNELCLVVIKPWTSLSRWRSRLAVREARRRARAAGSYGAVWLPHARPMARIWHGGIVVVGGDARRLFETIQAVIDTPAISAATPAMGHEVTIDLGARS